MRDHVPLIEQLECVVVQVKHGGGRDLLSLSDDPLGFLYLLLLDALRLSQVARHPVLSDYGLDLALSDVYLGDVLDVRTKRGLLLSGYCSLHTELA